MTPEQKIKHLIIIHQCSWDDAPVPEVTAENVDDLYDSFPCLQDARNEVRSGEVKTNIKEGKTPWSRGLSYYESHEVAAQMPDGSWVGWTYWYGGGKHSEPTAIEWMEYAYDLTCEEREKVIIVKEFTRLD